MRKKTLIGIFLSCLAFVPPAFSQDNMPPGPDMTALQTQAEQGDTDAQKKLGDHYFDQGNKENGLQWMLKSAQGGNAGAQSSLGYRYDKGNSVTQDTAESRKWYRMAAEQGHGTAQFNLCKSLANSLEISEGNDDPDAPVVQINGSKADMDDAIKWCGTVARRGDAPSQQRLGILYAKGSAEVTPDYPEAYFWLSLRKEPLVLRDKIAENLTEEQRTEIEQRVKTWEPE